MYECETQIDKSFLSIIPNYFSPLILPARQTQPPVRMTYGVFYFVYINTESRWTGVIVIDCNKNISPFSSFSQELLNR